MSMLGAKKMRERRQAEHEWRALIRYWLHNGHDLNQAIVPKALPLYMAKRIVIEERIKFLEPTLTRIARMADAAAERMRVP